MEQENAGKTEISSTFCWDRRNLAPPVAKMLKNLDFGHSHHFPSPTTRVCQNMGYWLRNDFWNIFGHFQNQLFLAFFGPLKNPTVKWPKMCEFWKIVIFRSNLRNSGDTSFQFSACARLRLIGPSKPQRLSSVVPAEKAWIWGWICGKSSKIGLFLTISHIFNPKFKLFPLALQSWVAGVLKVQLTLV